MRIDHVLLIGFGGPTQPEEVRPFLELVARGPRIPPERLKEVEHHYRVVGGASPYNRHALSLSSRLEQALGEANLGLPVFLGMRYWHPFLSDTLAQVKQRGLRRGLGIVLAPHRSEASFERYVRSLEEARQTALAQEVYYEILEPWYDHPLFLEAQADRARGLWEPMPQEERAATHVLFSAHSIPVEMARQGRYEDQIRVSSRGVAERLGCSSWSVAFQSRSGPPTQPWLEPDVRAVVAELKGRGIRNLLVIPIGFLFDHMEVLYDLDVELRDAARGAGLSTLRAPTVADHPKFVAMLAHLIRERT